MHITNHWSIFGMENLANDLSHFEAQKIQQIHSFGLSFDDFFPGPFFMQASS